MYNEPITDSDRLYCPTKTHSWQLVLEAETLNDVKVVRTLGRLWGNCALYINGEEKECDLRCHPCTPWCSDDGIFSWEHQQHNFMLLLRGPLLTEPCGMMYLFVDGVEVHSNIEFSVYWRNLGFRMLLYGFIVFTVGLVVAYFLLTLNDGDVYFNEGVLYIIPVIVLAFLYCVCGVFTIFKYRHARDTANQQLSLNWKQKINLI